MLQRAFPISEPFKTDMDLWVFRSNEIPLGRVLSSARLLTSRALQENIRRVSLITKGQTRASFDRVKYR